jgi:hypothetical protein
VISEYTAKSILVALRRDDITSDLANTVKFQLFYAYRDANEFEKAVALFPTLRDMIGGRMRGIYVLAEGSKGQLLDSYFKKIPNAYAGLIKAIPDPKSPTPDSLRALYHFGTLLPLYFLLSSCVHLERGVCGNCTANSEEKIRAILGPGMASVKTGLLSRLCTFASNFA